MYENIIQSMPKDIIQGLADGKFDCTKEEYLRKRVEWQNSVEGDLEGEYCEDCKNRGYTVELRGDKFVSVECKCMIKRRNIARIRKSGLENVIQRYTFKAYKTLEKWQMDAKKLAWSYAHDDKRKWFLAAGSVGAGKSHLCTAICSKLMQDGLETRYMLWKDESVPIKANVNNSYEYSRLINPLKNVKVLYIDDFLKSGSSTVSIGDLNLAIELLNYRYQKIDSVTIISTEYTLDQLIDIDESLGSRIRERCKDSYVEFTGDKNWRLK